MALAHLGSAFMIFESLHLFS